jgi:hypothetical protein
MLLRYKYKSLRPTNNNQRAQSNGFLRQKRNYVSFTAKRVVGFLQFILIV